MQKTLVLFLSAVRLHHLLYSGGEGAASLRLAVTVTRVSCFYDTRFSMPDLDGAGVMIRTVKMTKCSPKKQNREIKQHV